ncbi:MAG: DMT family transporter [Rhodocyclaceae bacterium]|jgi:drug/metabolite transporter (DMT)-like permease|nr:DMT family transporter [Rhodocyclaceae bacterium]MBK6907917.1 DMT family transporter [Rhodocyclaceae bacterium]
MLAASLLFACMGVCVKLSADHFSANELIWWRGAIATALILPWVLVTRSPLGTSLGTRFWRLHLVRGLSGVAALIFYFHAITLIPLATAVTLNYTSPLFLGVLLHFGLKQRVSEQLRWAIAIGFVGLILVLRPSIASDQWLGALLGLGSGCIASIAYLTVRQLGEAGEPEWRTVFYFSLMSCLAGLPGLITSAPLSAHSGKQWLVLIGIGLFGLAAQLCMTSAYRRGQPLVTASLSNSTVLFASAFGMVLWGEHLPVSAWVGVALIVAGGTLANLARPTIN